MTGPSTDGAGERDAVALLVSLDDATAKGLEAPLRERGLSPKRVRDASQAPSILDFQAVEVVFARVADHASLTELCDFCTDVPVVAVIPGDDEEAVSDALRAGAVATILEATSADDLRPALDRALSGRDAPKSSEDVPPPAPKRRGLLGESEAIQHVLQLISRAAPVMATALVRGETGTGKELVARALHQESPRKDGPFIKVHCAALPDALLESEIFGYEKGAFTGATVRKPGRVELAEHGTLFLDEIGDITPAVQVKLLRLLQDREYERLGGVRTLCADVRFVAATHRDLEGMVKRGEFREDLFYRLNVVTLWLPPLRARRDDITLLANAFATEFAKTYGKGVLQLDESAIKVLRAERWPGNVRQLQNFIERLVVLATGQAIAAADVQREMGAQAEFKTQLTNASIARRPLAAASETDESGPASTALTLEQALRDAERLALDRALRHAGGNRTVAARILGVSRATVYTKMQEYGLK